LSTWRGAGVTFALSLVLVACAAQVSNRQHPENGTEVRPQDKTMPSERSEPRDAKPAASLPSEDAPGRDVPDLPRYPGSVRVECERKVMDALVLTRARYLSHEKIDTVRGFYRGVFRSEGWKVANAEFSDDEWTFLVVKGEREAEIEVRPHDTGSETEMWLSAPQPREQSDKKAVSEASPPQREAAPEPTPSPTPAPTSPASASPAPASAPPSYGSASPAFASPAPASVPPAPATAPGGYEFEEDYSDDFEGGDD
jgi:hypothetical protein